MSTPLEEVLPGNGASMPETGEHVVEPNLERTTEQPSNQEQAAQPNEDQPGEPQVEHERRRGSGAQIDSLKEQHRKELEEAKAETRRATDEDWRRNRLPGIAARERQAAIEDLERRQQQSQDPVERVLNDPRGLINEAISEREAKQQQKWERKSHRDAVRSHGKENVDEAFRAVVEFSNSHPDGEKFAQYLREESDDPYDDIVQWHSQQKRSSLVSDPRVSTLLDKANTDPALLDRISAFLEAGGDPQALQQGNGQQVQQHQGTMPSNFANGRNLSGVRSTGPAFSPASIFDIVNRPRTPG